MSATLPTPDDLRSWREARGLTQTEAGELADLRSNVLPDSKRRQWQRWEYGDEPAPQWLREVLWTRTWSRP